VGILIDDVPYGSPTGLTGRGQPDIDPGDLARVEVLRGPQGTLYGVSSMGGLLKFVTIDPSTDSLSGRVQVGTNTFFNGVAPGYNFRGSVNVPIVDTIAIRASAFRTQDPGYIEDIGTGQRGVNRHTSDGGRLALLWKPSDTVSLKLSALVQDAKRDGAEVAVLDTGFGDLQESSIRNTQTTEVKTQAYSATLKAKFGGIELTSLTGFNVDHFLGNHDTTYVLPIGGGLTFWDYLANTYLNTTGHGSAVLDLLTNRNFSQELRLSIPIVDQVNLMIGGFYTDEKNVQIENNYGADLNTGALTENYFLGAHNTNRYKEYAAFANLTYNVTDQFDVQFGGRWSEVKQVTDIEWSGPSAPDLLTYLSVPDIRSKDTPFTYLVTPRYKISPDLMVYARLASGYRPGGANQVCAAQGIPCSYDPEKTKNYELGFKGDFFDRTLSLDASLYRIDWKDILETLSGPPPAYLSYYVNLGAAKSQGVELSMNMRPVRGLTLGAWVAYDDAKYTATLPATVGLSAARPGDRIEGTSRFSGNLSVDEEFILTGRLTAFAGGVLSYIGDRLGGIQAPGIPRDRFPAYAQVDLHAGVKYDTWNLSVFANNVADKRGILEGGADYQYEYPNAHTYSIIQPRNVGFNVSKTF
jgi:outer membrane receptor protein involved in Fe transport